ncbi:response regulator transcription factor [Porticoccus sp.]|jgi:DNA-binding NarL/FixJ family response regulator|uniref:response regulator n=1 Tax=Porticoccus sp. TaxID=2024853 RepID=UPI000C4191F4|nr:response regulator transcription factor [Porticoccus sp.]MAZ70605.1 DNA-binding response regulator [Porticoccus sp.]|tara:strand:+ start:6905 stop:7567 length:663 start_codon:yes stop_codon:yes gene_type:complete
MSKFIVADDHPLFRNAIAQVLQTMGGEQEVVEAQDMASLQIKLSDHPDTDLVLLDLHMPGAHGFSALAYVQGHCGKMPVLVVSANEKTDIIQRALEFGARGFLPKSSSVTTILEAIQTVLQGDIWLPPAHTGSRGLTLNQSEQQLMAGIASLTPQQYLVLTMLAEGLLNKQIAYELDVTEATIKAHMTAIFRKLGVRSRTQAVLAIGKLNLEESTGSEEN